jgi:hypothetical protein
MSSFFLTCCMYFIPINSLQSDKIYMYKLYLDTVHLGDVWDKVVEIVIIKVVFWIRYSIG